MPKDFLGLRTRKVASGSEHRPQHKQTSCPSLMARNYRLYARVHRFCGCFFIRGMFGGKDQAQPRVVWQSWYTLYSCAFVGLGSWIYMDVLVAFTTHATGLDNKLPIRVVVHSILFVRMIVSFLYASFGSYKLLAFYLRASAFERRIGTTFCDHAAYRRFFWSEVREVILGLIFCVVYTLALIKASPYGPLNNQGDSSLNQAYFCLKTVFIVIFFFAYDGVCIVALKSACEVLVEYLRKQLQVLESCHSVPDVRSSQCIGAARCAENVRINVAAIRRLKEEVNGIWGLPLILSTLCVLLVVCNGVYELCRQGALTTQMWSYVVYTLWHSYCFVRLASASQSLTNEVKKIKDFCKGLGGIDDSYYGHQIEDLHDSIQPEDMCIKGGNFFHLNMSLLVSMAAAVITYTVILLQTHQSLNKSWNETSAIHHSFT